MSKFLGARISLISNSDIRYVGTLHQINSEDSTVSLENVRSFGTEGRKVNPGDEVAPSDQFYEYIVFRGTDVKDLRVEEGPSSAKEEPPAMPNDPAIVGLDRLMWRPALPALRLLKKLRRDCYRDHHKDRLVILSVALISMDRYPVVRDLVTILRLICKQFPPGPVGPAPWNNYAYPPGPGGPPGIPGGPSAPGAPGQGGRQSSSQTPSTPSLAPKPSPIGPLTEKKPLTPTQKADSPSKLESTEQLAQELAAAAAPPPPVESKPTEEEVKATAVSLSRNAPPTAPREASKFIPTGPKNISRPTQILPAVPLPVGLTSRASQQAQASSSKPAGEQINNAEALRDATQAAKAAVAVAMANLAQLDGSAPAQQLNNTPAMDNLTKKVNEMRVNSGRQAPAHVGRGGRGRGPRPAKVEVPDSDFDFASANAKFNKQEIVKEAISGSPLTETANGDALTPEAVVDASVSVAPAYNPSRSFFDNISSEAKDRLENTGPKPGGREWRGEEQRRNMETFGQGSVDGGFRGFRGGRGRGRGGRGRGYRGRGGNAGYRQHDAQAPSQ
ncbi:Scd6-like Sm domain-containing protein [Lasiosphaeria miniovina]|uniref:Scd6-like Sm domain-containing protein n=1 Tax=Lasiosphaeria miniovina TaxID=1954250 RepID=A0AA40DN33_9PEZI|nr:Scd6-like Sm domain-containing protein [Lasiosphaeria miniovina]KAK0706912.1 Scd6-like Sm domain-containing protein [Lasiosphaeria miniovina]